MMKLTKEELNDQIRKLRQEKNAIILAHFYQIPEIQDIADYIGDSLALAQYAVNVQADIILFAGVHFMAETAKILNPEKKVLIPDIEAGCSLADSCPSDAFREFISRYPDHRVVSYINCSADVKGLSDVICTSSNAVRIVESFPAEQKIIFAPDRNLGAYINQVTGRNMVLWDGSCEVHDVISLQSVVDLKLKHPDAKVIAHPECKALILELADYIGSTTGLINFTKADAGKKYIVATETGILHAMKKASPDKEFYIVPTDKTCLCNDCLFMKKNTLEKVYLALRNEQPEIVLSTEVMNKALDPIKKMLELSQ